MHCSSYIHDARPLANEGQSANAQIQKISAKALPSGMAAPRSRMSREVTAIKLLGDIAYHRRVARWMSFAAASSVLGAIDALTSCPQPRDLPPWMYRGRQASSVQLGHPAATSFKWANLAIPGAAAHGGSITYSFSLLTILMTIIGHLADGLASIQRPHPCKSLQAGAWQFGPRTQGAFASCAMDSSNWRRPIIRRSSVMMAAMLLLQFCGTSAAIGERLGAAGGEDAILPQSQANTVSRASAQTAARQALPARAVANLLGVQPDLNQGNWASIEGSGGMIEQARFVGAGILRVNVPDPDNWATPHLSQLVAAGLRLNFIAAPYAPPDRNVLWIKDFLTQFPGSVAFVEGPNEPNNFAVEYAGETGVGAAVRWQADFYAAMKADPVTAHIPVYGLASFPKIAAASDVNNLHVYPIRARQARRAIEDEAREQQAIDPGKPWGITEFGYFTIPGFEPPGQYWEGVDEITQAKLLANAYLDAASLGTNHLILFNLRDWCSTRPDDVNAHFGLFRCDNRPKPAAHVLRNIAALLADHGEDFRPGRLSFRTNASSQVRNLLLQRSDGSFILIFWRTPDVWDENADRRINHEDQRFTLQFGTRQASVQVFDPLTSAEAVWFGRNAQQVPVAIADGPILVVIGPR
jgi:hypothetical protein